MALDDPVRLKALQQRYGNGSVPAGVRWNDMIAILLDHRSVRAYTSKPLPCDTAETLVAAAQSAPSSSNLQLWSVIAVTDQEAKAQYAVLAGNQRHIDDAPLLLLFLADHARTEALGQREGRATDGLAHLDSFLVSAVDAALAAQNASIAAQSLGLGTVYIGGLRNQPDAVAALAGLPPRATVLFGLVVGFPDPKRPAAVKPRLPQQAILHHERYNREGHEQAIQTYEDASRQFQRQHALPEAGWITPALDRTLDAEALNGREALRSTLKRQGFDLT